MITCFRIGYAPDSGFLLRDRLRGDFDEELLRESGLFSWKKGESARLPEDGSRVAAGRPQETRPQASISDSENVRPFDSARNDNEPEAGSPKPQAGLLSMYSKFRNRVIFPIANESGKIIAFTGRTLSRDEKAGPKYLNSPETAIYSKSRVLFNLDRAKEAIRKLDYAILVEGQMDCISVFAAGFQNVIASSGTAFTEIQAKLLGRFSKNVVVNFDPDAAGAKATERTLGLLVQEEFQIKVLTLEAGFDPDLFIRRKGKEAYAEALRHSQSYFDYLIERARSQFPVRSAEGKVKAVNYLLPHIQRVPSRIIRDELAHEIAQKLGIDSAVLRQELKHAATSRSAATLKAPAEAQVTEAERILVRALASASQMQTSEEHSSSRDGAEEEFDPARQARFVLASERLHQGLATESLVDALLNVPPDAADIVSLPLSDFDRRLLASILMREDEELTPDGLERAVRALRKKALNRRLKEIERALDGPSRTVDLKQRLALAEERLKVKRALMDPGLADVGGPEEGPVAASF